LRLKYKDGYAEKDVAKMKCVSKIGTGLRAYNLKLMEEAKEDTVNKY
jgi:hypothetical protein